MVAQLFISLASNALHFQPTSNACSVDSTSLLNFLMDKVPPEHINKNSVDGKGNTPVHLCVESGLMEHLSVLLRFNSFLSLVDSNVHERRGVKLDIPNTAGDLPLHLAAKSAIGLKAINL